MIQTGGGSDDEAGAMIRKGGGKYESTQDKEMPTFSDMIKLLLASMF
jgi:hypothetical protein